MSDFMPKILRATIAPLIFNKSTYLLGMVLIRFSRKLRTRKYTKGVKNLPIIIKKCMGNITMKVDKTSYMGGSIYWSGFHHVNEIVFLNNFLQPNMVLVDIGANQGEFSLFAASKLTEGKVISFEPVSKQHGMLTENITLNSFKNIIVNNYGLSDQVASLPIYTSLNEDLHSGIHEGLSTLFATGDRVDLEETIDLKIFDIEFENKLEKIDFIKIDIEGSELFALKGMRNHLSRFKPMILIELNDDTFGAANYTVKDVTDYLEEFGYQAYTLFRGKITKHEGAFSTWGNYIFKAN
jgi:FkbM family methyltransferase